MGSRHDDHDLFSDQVLYEFFGLCEIQIASFARARLLTLVPDLVKVLLQVAIILFVRELLPVGQHRVREFHRSFSRKHFLVLDHVALVVPGLLGKFAKLHLDITLVVLLVILSVVVGKQERLLIAVILFTYVINKVLELRLIDEIARVARRQATPI